MVRPETRPTCHVEAQGGCNLKAGCCCYCCAAAAGLDPILGVLYAQQEVTVLNSAAPEAAGSASPQTVQAYNGKPNQRPCYAG